MLIFFVLMVSAVASHYCHADVGSAVCEVKNKLDIPVE